MNYISVLTCFTSKSSSSMKQDRFEFNSPKSTDGSALTGVVIMVPSWVVVDGDCTENVGNGNMVATPSANSITF